MTVDECTQQALHKYIDLIEDVITRMASNSFMLKGWSLTIVAAVFALNLSSFASTGILFFGIAGIVVVFGILDAYYLSMERGFRKIYQDVVTKANENEFDSIEWYSLTLPRPNGEIKRFFAACKRVAKAALSFSVWAFYGILVFGIIGAFFFFQCQPADSTQKIILENEKNSVQFDGEHFDFSCIEQKLNDIDAQLHMTREYIEEHTLAKDGKKQADLFTANALHGKGSEHR